MTPERRGSKSQTLDMHGAISTDVLEQVPEARYKHDAATQHRSFDPRVFEPTTIVIESLSAGWVLEYMLRLVSFR